jgi:hypothetical protein
LVFTYNAFSGIARTHPLVFFFGLQEPVPLSFKTPATKKIAAQATKRPQSPSVAAAVSVFEEKVRAQQQEKYGYVPNKRH